MHGDARKFISDILEKVNFEIEFLIGLFWIGITAVSTSSVTVAEWFPYYLPKKWREPTH